MHKENTKFHKDFRLNNTEFTSIEFLLLYVKENETVSYSFLKEWFNNEDFVIIQTSGSTGKPKPIKILKIHMINSAIATGHYFNLKEGTTALLCLSPNFIAGKMMLVRALVLGWHIDVVEPKSNPLDKNSIVYDFCAMVPMQVAKSLNGLHKIKQLIVGGGAVSNNLLEKLQSLKTKIFATYGMTETVTHIAIKKLNHCDLETSSFKIIPDIKISKDVRGCLVINAPKITSDRVITNDLVELIDGSNFKWLGRFDNIINSGGIKIVPEQVEEKLSKIILNRFFIASQKSETLGEELILIVEGKEISTIKDKINDLQTLPKFHKPKSIYFATKFIETKTGKINRKEILKTLF